MVRGYLYQESLDREPKVAYGIDDPFGYER